MNNKYSDFTWESGFYDIEFTYISQKDKLKSNRNDSLPKCRANVRIGFPPDLDMGHLVYVLLLSHDSVGIASDMEHIATTIRTLYLEKLVKSANGKPLVLPEDIIVWNDSAYNNDPDGFELKMTWNADLQMYSDLKWVPIESNNQGGIHGDGA